MHDSERYMPEDGNLVALRQSREIRYWMKRLGASHTRLSQAVAGVGHGAGAVTAWLADNPV